MRKGNGTETSEGNLVQAVFEGSKGGGRDLWKKGRFWIVVLGLLGFFLLLSGASSFIVQWLWMGQLGYEAVFWRTLALKAGAFTAAFLFVLSFIWGNLQYAARRIFLNENREEESEVLSAIRGPALQGMAKPAVIVFSLFTAFLFGTTFTALWERFLLYIWGGSFGTVDPVYGRDIGFYIFRLPLLRTLESSLLWLFLFTFLVVAAGYALAGLIPWRRGEVPQRSLKPVRHASLLLLLVVAVLGWKFYLDRFDLLFSSGGVVFGAGYTDLHVVRLGLWVMVAVSVLLGGAVLYTLVVHRINLIFIGSSVYLMVLALVIVLLPPLVQSFKVQPNELELERPYLERNIQFTRQSYRLDGIEERTYPALTTLTPEDIGRNRETVDNVRLWDWRPIKQTFRQTQEIRTYYQFYEVDVDRYYLEGNRYRQVMLSARELSPRLPEQARTWVNEKLQFTHGYGLAMSPVSTVTKDGLPSYLVKDLPPVTEEGLSIRKPAIYYGESMSGYRIVNTDVEEFDYPKGDENVYTRYFGRGGIPVSGLFRRLLFAWDQSEWNILLTSSIRSESRIQIRREISQRVSGIAPFLQLDSDPYLVLADGALYWIQDAYTVSSRYPYSEPFVRSLTRGDLNYIRNSVKIVMDAYEGSVDFYVVDEGEPVLKAYRGAFPGLFKDLDNMSPALRAHLRYPLDLFRIQAGKYTDYHMTIPQVFYNREDKWAFPSEKYAGDAIDMEPYYILIRLPEEPDLEFLLMTPMTPDNRDNMIAWIAARCDEPNYGHIVAYKLPKDKLIYGPIQIEAMIDQDDVISQQLSLWDQRGSRVIRGNLLVIPLERSFLYVEPVYLLAEGNDIPQLRRIIVVYDRMVSMERTIEEAINAIFGMTAGQTGTTPPSHVQEGAGPSSSGSALDQARETLRRAQGALERGDWETFGRVMQELQGQLGEN
jgi:uncharacterized membrane protein (UPF0182 family)